MKIISFKESMTEW